MSKRKILIAVLIVALTTSSFAFLRFRSSVTVKGSTRDDIMHSVTAFRQDDEIWADDTLGTSSFKMKKSGCITTCIATVLSSGSDMVTPGELNKLFTEKGIYDENGNLIWPQLEKISLNADVLPTVSENIIYSSLQSGQFPIVRVRVGGVGNFHYVLIVGIENGEYICMDPLKDNFTKLSDYFNRVYAIRVVY